MPSCSQVQPEGKYVVELDKGIDLKDVKPNLRVALRNDSYALHKVNSVHARITARGYPMLLRFRVRVCQKRQPQYSRMPCPLRRSCRARWTHLSAL